MSFINRSCYAKIGCPKLNVKIKINFDGFGVLNKSTYGSCRISVTIDGEIYEILFHVVDDKTMKHAVLIGADFLNLIDLRSLKDQVVIRRVPEESVYANNSELPEVFKIDVIKKTDSFDFPYISDKNVRREIEDITKINLRK